MNLKHLTDDELERDLGVLVNEERTTLTAILYHLLEVNRRRLYSKHRCESLHQYACKRFGYSENEAGLRITAMYLLKDVPAAACRIEKGSVSLTNLVQAQVHFRKEKKANIERTREEKLELLSKLENCSKTEAKQVIADEAETLFRVSGVQVPLSRNEEMPFRPCERLKTKLKRLREIKPGASLEDLIEQMADLALKTWDPGEKAKRAQARKEKRKQTKQESQSDIESPISAPPSQKDNQLAQVGTPFTQVVQNSNLQAIDNTKKEIPVPEPKRRVENPRAIKMQTRHEVHLRDQQACVNCGSRKNLEVDHISEFALGGSNETENLRLLCRSCNQRHAIESYGLEKMSSYLR